MITQSPFYIDFGSAFRDGEAICDYTGCQDSISDFLATVSAVIGRRITDDECCECERLLRAQYLKRLPLLRRAERDSHIYQTPWPLIEQGGRICVRIALVFHRNSIRVAGATSKMVGFELCDLLGKPIGAARNLPWHIVNFQALAYGLRNVWCGRFPHGLLSNHLYTSWGKLGGSCELPQRFPLGDTPAGQAMELELVHADSNSWDGGKPLATAELLLDGERVSLEGVQPRLLVDLDSEALDETAFIEFNGFALTADFSTLADLRSHLFRVYDLYAAYQSNDIVDMAEGWRVFNTCISARAGGDVFAVLSDRMDGGRFTSILWVTEESLRGYGCRIPARPNLHVEHFPASQWPVCAPQSHVLAHASRWAQNGHVIGEDEQGHDVFRRGADAVELYGRACEELSRTLEYVNANPDAVAYGYYNPLADRKGSNVQPVCAYLPAFFSETAKKLNRPDCAFVARFVKTDVGGQWEIPTILSAVWVKAPCRVLGRKMPNWVVSAA